jgi:cell wall-associated NlpC family hydrolase
VSAAVIQDENEFHYASKIREEVQREDDKKVDLTDVGKRLTTTRPDSANLNLTPEGVNRDRVLLDMVSFLGAPYRFGGNNKEGIDCSGFTSSIYASSMDRLLPRSAREQFQRGVPVDRQQLQFGDLVFFNTTGRSPSHVGIYIEDDLFAHASVTSGVTISSLESTYYKKRFIGARRFML